ncbi:MAG: DUF6624 domain-containing protein [Sphingomonas sp.]
MIRRLALLAATLLVTAEAPPPPSLAPYLKSGTFEPGDYGWMRGAFDDATPQQIADFQRLDGWLKQCRQESYARTRAELVALGIVDPKIHTGAYGDALCGAIDVAKPQGDPGRDWSLFQAKLASARRVADTLLWSVALAQAVGDDGDTLAAELKARPISDQVLRGAQTWNDGEVKGAPALDPMERAIVQASIWSAIRARDQANTIWLKGVVAKHGWPTIAMVGAEASQNAWLLVQHATADPAFQLRMLRLMAPLAATGQIKKSNYALLYDRVMLQMTGTQRYGTQWTCVAGRSHPLPLEDAATVEAFRRQVDLGTLADNAARIARVYGPCPSPS